ncbi:hypothetical protein ECPA10_2908, partial [Escherichia coli PA10]
MYPLNDS